MIYLPSLRRLLTPLVVIITFIIFYHNIPLSQKFHSFVIHPIPVSQQGTRISIDARNLLTYSNASLNHISPPHEHYYSHDSQFTLFDSSSDNANTDAATRTSNLAPLLECEITPNKFTNHIRLPNILQNISFIPHNATKADTRTFWNPTIIALPYWSTNQYLVVQRILTSGAHQENVLCEANICYPPNFNGNVTKREQECSEEDLALLGPAGGMRCAHPPVPLSVPPTPAEYCADRFSTYMDIPGFHDPRIFWSGKGEPLMMVNTQSRYACFGLWIIDLRTLYSPLHDLLSSPPKSLSLGPLRSYPFLTELTRNPPSSRGQIEKNWMLFFTPNGEAYIHYDLPSLPPSNPSFNSSSDNTTATNSTATKVKAASHGRTFAKLLGNGLTSPNLTDPTESSCLASVPGTSTAKWHQATNALRLVLCSRSDPHCHPSSSNTVFFALVHRKFQNSLKLPLRYERLFIVWASTPPFHMLAVSKHPVLLWNETALGATDGQWWTASQIWDDDAENTLLVERNKKQGIWGSEPYGGRDYWASFTYTVSISYAWGREPRPGREREGKEGDAGEDMHVGFIDDEVVVAVGVDDEGGVFGRVKAGDLLGCMLPCPGKVS